MRGYADIWRDTAHLSDQQIADLVRSDQIDILVDLKMHTADNQLLVFARKPAPVQVIWLGYAGTTGLSAIDYRLTDPYLDPPGRFDAFYSEESIRLPHTFWCYEPFSGDLQVGSLPALDRGFVTFGCLNNFCKVNEGCVALWVDILHEVPRSRLLLVAPRGRARHQLLARFQRDGIAEPRIEFVDRVDRREYLELYNRVDLCLDPFPYNGGTTTLDAFWMGVPTITLVGHTAAGRAGWSQSCNLDLQELAAHTPQQYVTLAAQVAEDLSWLQDLRGTLRQRMRQSPLMDGKLFARHVEEAYRRMWRRWCQSPASPRGPALARYP
jgi:predicted O-linked N-acetylglucosamine transferase (SPINDLY family)